MRLIKASMMVAVFFAVAGWTSVAFGQEEEERFQPAAQPEGSTGFGASYTAEGLMRPRLSGGLQLGFGGNAGFSPSVQGFDNDLDVTTGVHARMEFPLHPYIALGGLSQITWWNADGMDNRGIDRSVLWDFSVYPKGRIPFRISGVDGAFYLTVPVGFTAGLINEDIRDLQNVDSINDGLGWNIGVLGGAEILATERFGAMVEMGWMHHWTTHDVSGGPNTDIDLDQFVINVGATVGI